MTTLLDAIHRLKHTIAQPIDARDAVKPCADDTIEIAIYEPAPEAARITKSLLDKAFHEGDLKPHVTIEARGKGTLERIVHIKVPTAESAGLIVQLGALQTALGPNTYLREQLQNVRRLMNACIPIEGTHASLLNGHTAHGTPGFCIEIRNIPVRLAKNIMTVQGKFQLGKAHQRPHFTESAAGHDRTNMQLFAGGTTVQVNAYDPDIDKIIAMIEAWPQKIKKHGLIGPKNHLTPTDENTERERQSDKVRMSLAVLKLHMQERNDYLLINEQWEKLKTMMDEHRLGWSVLDESGSGKSDAVVEKEITGLIQDHFFALAKESYEHIATDIGSEHDLTTMHRQLEMAGKNIMELLGVATPQEAAACIVRQFQKHHLICIGHAFDMLKAYVGKVLKPDQAEFPGKHIGEIQLLLPQAGLPKIPDAIVTRGDLAEICRTVEKITGATVSNHVAQLETPPSHGTGISI